MVRYKVGRPVIDARHDVRFPLYEFCERQLFVFITAQPQPCIVEGTMNLFYKTAYLVPGMLHIPGLVSNSCIYDIPVPGMSLEYLTKNLT